MRILPQLQIAGGFNFSRHINIIVYLNIVYIVANENYPSRKATETKHLIFMREAGKETNSRTSRLTNN